MKRMRIEGETDPQRKARFIALQKLHDSVANRYKQASQLMNNILNQQHTLNQKLTTAANTSTKLQIQVIKTKGKMEKEERDKQDAAMLQENIARQSNTISTKSSKVPKPTADTYPPPVNYSKPPPGLPNSFGIPPPQLLYSTPPMPHQPASALADIFAPFAAAFGTAIGNQLGNYMTNFAGSVEKTPEQVEKGNAEANKEN
jgi:hypothetical protein